MPAEPPPEPMPRLAIRSPESETIVASDSAVGHAVVIDDGGWLAGAAGRRIAIFLDDFRVRYRKQGDPAVTLGDLVPDNVDLSYGEHLIAAVPVHSNGELVKPNGDRAPHALARFWVGERRAPLAPLDAPFLFYAEPQGTYNGAAAANSARIDFYVVNSKLAENALSLEATVSGAGGTHTQRLVEWRPYLLSGLTSGDHTVTLRLVDPQGKPLARPRTTATAVITVNLDAPVPNAR
jgi:hypothetical protein